MRKNAATIEGGQAAFKIEQVSKWLHFYIPPPVWKTN